jgi:hypothetical protein
LALKDFKIASGTPAQTIYQAEFKRFGGASLSK